MTLLGTFLVTGMVRIAPALPSASSASGGNVSVGDDGVVDDDDDDGDTGTAVGEEDASDASPLSSWSPPPDLAAVWDSLVGVSSSGSGEDSASWSFYQRSCSSLVGSGFGLSSLEPGPLSSLRI